MLHRLARAVIRPLYIVGCLAALGAFVYFSGCPAWAGLIIGVIGGKLSAELWYELSYYIQGD